jgi:hypothetical protein
MPDYLVCSSDTAVSKSDYRIVAADSPSAALEVFNRRIVAYDRVFRNAVLDLAMNMSFVERFYLATPQENYHFNETASASVNDVTVKARVREFFSENPEYGEAFIAYMDDDDPRHITDEIFEFIAVRDDGGGFEAIDLGAVTRL